MTGSSPQPASHVTPAYPASIRDAYTRAYHRAATAVWNDVNGDAHIGLVAFKWADGQYDVPSISVPGKLHRVVKCGRRWSDLSCDCKAAKHPACIHRAVVVHAIKYHVHAKWITIRSTAEDVALSQRVTREILDALIAGAALTPSPV